MTKTLSNVALKDMYDTYSALVYNLALNYLNNNEDAEEITQDVFITVYQSIHKFNEQSSFKTWVYKITVNKCLDFLRAKKRKKRWATISSIFNDAGILQHNVPDFIHPGVLLENKENTTQLFKAIDKLPETQRTVFVLSHIENLNNKEIAVIMDKTLSSIESLIQRAKDNLRRNLSNFFDQYRRN